MSDFAFRILLTKVNLVSKNNVPVLSTVSLQCPGTDISPSTVLLQSPGTVISPSTVLLQCPGTDVSPSTV